MIAEVLPKVKGWIKIYGINSRGERFILVDQHNDLVVNSHTIIANLLGGQSSYSLDRISVYKTGGLLANSTLVNISYPSLGQVKFTARFLENSFNDTLDELKLQSIAGGEFSHVTGLSVLKDNTLQLEIQWLLTINNV